MCLKLTGFISMSLVTVSVLLAFASPCMTPPDTVRLELNVWPPLLVKELKLRVKLAGTAAADVVNRLKSKPRADTNTAFLMNRPLN